MSPAIIQLMVPPPSDESTSSSDNNEDGEGRGSIDNTPDPMADSLIARIQAGDSDAFDTLFRRYYAQLFAFASSYGRANNDLAEDIVCDVFTWLWQNRRNWLPKASIESYLYGAVRNKVQNLTRDSLRDLRRRDKIARFDELPGSSQMPPAADIQIENRETNAIVRNCIDELPEIHRLIVLLRWELQWSWGQIAEAVGLSSAAAQMQHQRALKTIRKNLPDHFFK